MASEVEYLLDLPELFLLLFLMPPMWDKKEISEALVQSVPRKAVVPPVPPLHMSGWLPDQPPSPLGEITTSRLSRPTSH